MIHPEEPSELPCRIAIVGGLPTRRAEELGVPFTEGTGAELSHLLNTAGISRQECWVGLVFRKFISGGDIANICVPKKVATEEYKTVRPELVRVFPDFTWPVGYSFKPIKSGKNIKPSWLGVLAQLKQELERVQPNLILGLGPIASWALLNAPAYNAHRGTVAESTLVPGVKTMITYDPKTILAQWEVRPVALVDMVKAERESWYPEIRRPQREIWIEPDLADLERFWELELKNAARISVDVETKNKQITCIGFSAGKHRALVLPFVDEGAPGNSYWRSAEDEVRAWEFVRRVMGGPAEKLGQNFLYDIQYIWKAHGIRPRNCLHDTMLMHHALQPEMKKDLGFLGSIYTDEASWKLMRPRGTVKEEKADA